MQTETPNEEARAERSRQSAVEVIVRAEELDMPVIERYVVAGGAPPSACRLADNLLGQHCMAEVVIRDGKEEERLCRSHAALRLAGNSSLLARAVVELYLPPS